MLAAAVGCRDLSRFSTGDDSYGGSVVKAGFVRAGVDDNLSICLTLDTDHLQDTPGHISSSDGRFHAEPLRPIPQIWHDPLSTFSFGEGRDKNLFYIATPSAGFADGGDTADVSVIVSLMTSGGVEVRLVRGAPPASSASSADASDTVGSSVAAAPNIFAVFLLSRQRGTCSY